MARTPGLDPQGKGFRLAQRKLVLFAMNVQPVGGNSLTGRLRELIQASAALSRRPAQGHHSWANGFGKVGCSICPPPGSGETCPFVLYALPNRSPLPRGFKPHQLRDRILEESGNVG